MFRINHKEAEGWMIDVWQVGKRLNRKQKEEDIHFVNLWKTTERWNITTTWMKNPVDVVR